MQSARLGVSLLQPRRPSLSVIYSHSGNFFFGPLNPPTQNGRCGNPDCGFGKFPPGSNPAAGNSHEEGLIFLKNRE
jgi:hypothetical protein